VQQALEAEPGAADEVVRLEGARRADVCIVGGGYTGLWTAIRLLELEPALDVVVLDADLCGTGASGRNGGIVSDWWMELERLAGHLGRDHAVRMAELVAGGADELERFCLADGIDAHLARGGWLWTASTPAQVASLRGAVQATRAVGASVYREVGPDELPSERDLFALADPRGGTVQPALLARGLRRAAIRRGATVLERSPVERVSAGARVEVRCAGGGVVSAEHVVLAANAWQAGLAELRRDTIVVSSDLIATAPAPRQFASMGWDGREVSFDAKTMLHYWRTTRDDRVVMGTAGTKLAFRARVGTRFERPAAGTAQRLEDALGRVLPAMAGSQVTHAWSGAVDRSASGLPRIGNLGGDPRITYVTGFSGTGVVPCVTVGRSLASVVLGRDDEPARAASLLRRSANALPPEPVRYLGGRLVQGAIASKERAEEVGRRPPRLATALAGLLPAGPTRAK
jgi:glycine/D-amino acid oxidase-like deaminating enzyme